MTDAVIIIFLIVILAFALMGAGKRLKGGCCGGAKQKKIKPKDTNTAHYGYCYDLRIDGMTCEHCKIRVENLFNSLDGCFAKVNLKDKSAALRTKKPMSSDEISAVLSANGYVLSACSASNTED